MAEWSKALAWKVSIRQKRIVGSNPTRSATQSEHSAPSSERRVDPAALAGLQGPIRFQLADMRRLRLSLRRSLRRSLRAYRNQFGFPVLRR